MDKLSVVVITYNEKKNIGRCLESVKSVADEIVVLDSNSTDETVAISEEHGARVVRAEWAGFVDTKNMAVNEASNDYVLALDADEALSPELADSIAREKASFSGAYRMSRLNNYCGKWLRHGGFYPDKKLRLFNRKEGRWTGEQVHEKVSIEPGVRIKDLQGDLLHYSYYSIADHVGRINRYSGLAADRIAARKGSVQTLWIRVLVNPAFRFFKMYFFSLGVLDGFYGLCACTITSWEVFLKYAKAIALIKKQGRENRV